MENDSGETSLSEIIRVLKQDKKVNAMGYPITENLYQSFMMVDHSPQNFIPKCNTLLVSISMMERPNFPMKEYYSKLQTAEARVTFKHVNAETFWDHYWQRESKMVAGDSTKWVHNIDFDN